MKDLYNNKINYCLLFTLPVEVICLLSIEENILLVNKKIKEACKRAGRCSNEVKLIAVSKTASLDSINKALECGITTFGENRVQEIVDKVPYVDNKAEWNMIGHLQTNKVKYIVDKVSMIQSVDSIRLVQEIDKRFGDYGKAANVLVEINIGREESKTGIDIDDTIDFITKASAYENIKLCGLMTVAPICENSEMSRPYFRRMREEFDLIKSMNIKNVDMKYLSMGMTGDFEVAIEEGSNMVRIGTGIFGKRNY